MLTQFLRTVLVSEAKYSFKVHDGLYWPIIGTIFLSRRDTFETPGLIHDFSVKIRES